MPHRHPLRSALLGLLLPLPLAAQEPHPTEPVAEVGGVAITPEDLRAEVNRLIPLTFYHAQVPEERLLELQRQGLANLIERELIHQDAVAHGLTATEDEVRERFRAALEDAGPGYADLEARQRRALYERLRPRVLRRLLIEKNEARFSAGVPAVTAEELRSSYATRKDELLTPEEVRFRHIFVQVDPAASAEELAQAREVMADIEGWLAVGESFESLARAHSNDIFAEHGGDMGFVKRGSFALREVEEVAFALEDGQISGAVLSLEGFHLVQRVETRSRRTLTFEEAREDLAAELLAERRRRAREAWLGALWEHCGVRVLAAELDPRRATAAEDGAPTEGSADDDEPRTGAAHRTPASVALTGPRGALQLPRLRQALPNPRQFGEVPKAQHPPWSVAGAP